MTNKTFLKFVLSCRMPRLDDKLYLAVGLGGECGEVLNEVKKEYRSGLLRREQVLDEMGDTLHYMVSLAERYGITLNDIMRYNVIKLRARHGLSAKNAASKPKQSRAVWRSLQTIMKTLRTRTGGFLRSLLDSLEGTLSKKTLRSMRSMKRSLRW